MLAVKNVSKSFGVVRALNAVNLDIAAGEVRALLGSNGAGKTTLVKILSGALKADLGEVRLDGQPVSFDSPAQATEAGVTSVYQELSLIPGLSVAENIMLGRWRKQHFLGLPIIDRQAMRRDAQRALEYFGEPLDLDAPVHRLSVGLQQIVEVAKALSTQPKLLILDEPTSALSKEEADSLIALVRRLATQGLAIIYVSHRMDEIPRVADTLTVMRDGYVVDTLPVGEAPTERVARMMVAGTWSEQRRREELKTPQNDVRLSVHGLTRKGLFHGVTFDLYHGEVLGIAGLMGSGRTELLRCLFGRDHADAGTITVDGRLIPRPTERRMISAGIGFAPEDRKSQGLVLPLSVGTNLAMAAYPRFVQHGVVSARRERELGSEAIAQLDIKAAGLQAPVWSLSGGNQQKVVIGKWLAARTQILLLDEPTRGIDIHAKEQMYEIVRGLAGSGKSVLIVSSEIEDLFQVCHRILVMNHGRLTATVTVEGTDVSEVLTLAMKEA